MHSHGNDDDDDDGCTQIGGPWIDRVYLTILSKAHSRILWLARAARPAMVVFAFSFSIFVLFMFYYLFVYHVWLII